MQSVTSNAVANALKGIAYNYYDANTDRSVLQNRINAIKAVIHNFEYGKFVIIRYQGGYYYSYIIPPKIDNSYYSAILELNPFGSGAINLFLWSGANYDITLVKSL